jgi:hypothetical protein
LDLDNSTVGRRSGKRAKRVGTIPATISLGT